RPRARGGRSAARAAGAVGPVALLAVVGRAAAAGGAALARAGGAAAVAVAGVAVVALLAGVADAVAAGGNALDRAGGAAAVTVAGVAVVALLGRLAERVAAHRAAAPDLDLVRQHALAAGVHGRGGRVEGDVRSRDVRGVDAAARGGQARPGRRAVALAGLSDVDPKGGHSRRVRMREAHRH